MPQQEDSRVDYRDESLGTLVGQLTDDIRTLVSKELELAKAELAVKGKRAGAGAGLLGGGGVLALLAAGALTTAIIAGLNEVMDLWLAALIVAVIYGAIAAVLALRGKNKVQEAAPPVPERTMNSVKEDVKWLKTQR